MRAIKVAVLDKVVRLVEATVGNGKVYMAVYNGAQTNWLDTPHLALSAIESQIPNELDIYSIDGAAQFFQVDGSTAGVQK
jgi:hypothetical protein